MATEQDQEFVEYVLKTVVDNPDDVQVTRTIDEMGVLISVSVNPDDMGKVIGKSGQTAKAIRTLLKVVGAKHDARVNMKIIEPEGGTGGNAAPAAGVADDSTQGSTEGVDDVPADDTSVSEAIPEQQTSDAAVPQPEENNSIVEEDSGELQPQEPLTEQPQDNSTTADDLAQHREKSPLDEL